MADFQLPDHYRALADRLADPTGLPQESGGRAASGAAQSAVLVLLNVVGEPDLVFTERNQQLRSHAGQISFPGGRRDLGDVDLCQTALRETQEEIGLDAQRVQVLGALPAALIPASGMNVAPIIGLWSGEDDIWPNSPAEVESIQRWKIQDLVDPRQRLSYAHPLGFSGPAWQFGNHFLWGFTAHVVDRILELGGWSRQWDSSRSVNVPERYLGLRPRG